MSYPLNLLAFCFNVYVSSHCDANHSSWFACASRFLREFSILCLIRFGSFICMNPILNYTVKVVCCQLWLRILCFGSLDWCSKRSYQIVIVCSSICHLPTAPP